MSLYEEYKKLRKIGKSPNGKVYDFNYRLDLKYDDIILLQELISNIEVEEQYKIVYDELKEIIDNPKHIRISIKKKTATELATKARISKVKEKINNAINILRLQDKEFTHYNIAKEAKVSFITVKKYLSDKMIEQLNNIEIEEIEEIE